MPFARIRTFFSQLRRYLASIASLLKGLFLYKPALMIGLLVLSIAGTTLQAFSLGSTFFILRHVDNQLLVEVSKFLPVLSGKVHATLMLAGVLSVLGMAVLLLYKAEKSAIELSRLFANSCGAALVGRFPVVINRLKNPAINPKNGIPVALSSNLKKQSGKLEIASRRLLNSPMCFFQVLYGVGFLLYLEPWLTLILSAITVPLMAPLKRLTLGVKESEKRRTEASKSKGGEVVSLSRESSRLLLVPNQLSTRIQEIFDATGFAAANYHRSARLTAVAGSRAIATATMVITGMASMLYFWLFYSGREAQVALIVVYFGSLRMAVMSGRQIVIRMSGFARFYEPVQEFTGDESLTAGQEKVSGKPRIFGVTGPDLTKDSGDDVLVRGNGPFAVAAAFPLMPINRYAVTLILPKLNNRRRAAVISRMSLITEDLDLDPDVTWRRLLGIDTHNDKSIVTEKLEACCRILDPQMIAVHLDEPLRKSRKNGVWSQKEAVEAMFLRAYFLEAPLVVAREAALDRLGNEAVEHWKRILADRLLFIYYQYDKQRIGRWGEQYVALVGSEAKEGIGVAPVEWANANPDRVSDMLMGRLGAEEAPWEDLDWDDDDDED